MQDVFGAIDSNGFYTFIAQLLKKEKHVTLMKNYNYILEFDYIFLIKHEKLICKVFVSFSKFF